MSDVLGVSITGLRVSQNALRTTGHNIANANTDGYSRQVVDINAFEGSPTGSGYLGNGAFTAKIDRVVNDFVTQQIRSDTSLYNEYNAYNGLIAQLNDVLANEISSLTFGLNGFFNAIQNLTDDPTSISSRQLLISEAQNLSDRFGALYNSILTIDENAKQNMEAAVNRINSLTTNLAELNETIGDSFGNSENNPNDLLDQRDETIRELSQLLSFQIVEQGNQVNASVGDGASLVIGSNKTNLTFGQNEFDPTEPEIYLTGLVSPITNSLFGGEIGGLLDFRGDVIGPALNELGRIGIVLADSFNELQQQGITLNNTFGSNLFNDINNSNTAISRVLPSGNNITTDQVISLSITDTEQLTLSDYRFSIDSGSNIYRIVRLSDDAEVSSNIMPTSFPASIAFDGLSLDITSGTYSSGDEFLIRPTRLAANQFSVMPIQPDDIALGSPVATSFDIGNQGNGQISAGEVLSLTDSFDSPLPLLATAGQMSPPLLVQFTTATTYDILDNTNPGNPIQLNPPIRNQIYIPGAQNELFSTDIGLTTVVSSGTDLGLPVGSSAVGAGLAVNGYPAEAFTFTTTDPNTGITSSQNIFSTANASARTTASLFDNVDGVTTSAFNYLELRDFTVTLNSPLQINLNGEDLIPYDSGAPRADVPSPAANSGEDFNDYLAQAINDNSALSNLGIYAVSAYDAINSEFYIQIHSTLGDDLTVQLEAQAGEVIEVNDGTNADVAITGAGVGNVNELIVGGRIDVNLASNISMSSTPTTSGLFGAISAASAYYGIQANISGTVREGDQFTIDFNRDADSDNRNGLAMVATRDSETIANQTQNIYQAYNGLVESIGLKASSSEIKTESSRQVLTQTNNIRDSVSGVNLDEEAANLIRYEQLYSANTQVINVARELFDRLLNSL